MAYNPYRWFTKGLKQRPLPKSAPLLLRIQNGDFEYSPYFYEAEEQRSKAKESYELTKQNALISDPLLLEREAQDSARMNRVKALKLMEVGHSDELRRLKELRDALTDEFGKDLWDKCMERQRGKGTTEDIYWWYKKQTKMWQTPSEIAIKLGRITTKGLK
jgi:hypothetical protein